MVDFINKIILDNPLVDYLMAAGFILLVIGLKKSASKKIMRVIFSLFRKMGRPINEQEFFDLVLQPLERFIVFLTVYFTVGGLNFPSALAFKIFHVQFDVILDRASIGILLYLFSNLLFAQQANEMFLHAEFVKENKIAIIGAFYDVETGEVFFFE